MSYCPTCGHAMPLSSDSLVSARVAARLVHVRQADILAALESGRLKARRLHGDRGPWRIRIADARRWAASKRRG